jgi:hypothetical protein
MEIVVRLRADAARDLLSGLRDAASARKLTAVLAKLGVELRSQHPGASDPEIQSYFTISGVSSAQAEHIASALRELDVVETAYLQPPVSPA